MEWSGEIDATGGFMLHYNMPFADLCMEVKENFRKRGLAGFILQELKQACYLAGRVPASRAALLKAGMRVCGFTLKGEIKTANG